MTVSKEVLDGLLADYKKPEDLIGENGLLKQLTKLSPPCPAPHSPSTPCTSRGDTAPCALSPVPKASAQALELMQRHPRAAEELANAMARLGGA